MIASNTHFDKNDSNKHDPTNLIVPVGCGQGSTPCVQQRLYKMQPRMIVSLTVRRDESDDLE